jgi:hypothetical protein
MNLRTKHKPSDVVETIRRRMVRSEELAGTTVETATVTEDHLEVTNPSSISHVHFAALSSRLAQVSAKASADAMSVPACAHDPMSMEFIARYLTDLRRLADAITELATGGFSPLEGNDR